MIRQSLEILNKHSTSNEQKSDILKLVLKALSETTITSINPPQLTNKVHSILKQELHIQDFYSEEKKESNKEALRLESFLNQLIASADNPLLTAAKLAIAGNVIDHGALASFDLNETISTVLEDHFAIDHFDRFEELVSKPNRILYLGDNAGEIVFDKTFISLLLKQHQTVIYAVKSAPVLNDVLLEDAKETGLAAMIPVIESGSTTAGTEPSEMNAEFRNYYTNSDLIIAKGLGNFETLYGLNDRKNKFFLFKVKCPHLGKYLNLSMKDIVFLEETF